MDGLLSLDPNRLILFTLALARVAGLAAVAPFYGASEVPLRVRAMLAVSLALLIAPSQSAAAPVAVDSPVRFLILLAAELIVGLFFGLGLAFLLSSMQLAGGLVGRLAGIETADVFDPASGETAPLLGRLTYLFGLVIFLLVGGHRMAAAALLDTFHALPPGSAASTASMTRVLQELFSQSFALGVRVAAPAIAALLLSTLVLGLIGRAMPQLNVLTASLGVNAMLGLGVLAISLGVGAMVFQAQIEPTLARLVEALGVT